MRTIKFRAKRLTNGSWVYGDLHLLAEHPHIHPAKGVSYLIKEDTVGQFTGMADINGRQIYEGDIVRVRVSNDRFKKNPRFRNGVVTFCEYDGGWTNGCYFRFLPQRMEVIGNIHDNPELMQGGEKCQ